MEENQNNQEQNKHICFENHCWKKCIAMVIASFLGGFLAFYFVADQIMEKHYKHRQFNPYHFEKQMFNDIEKMYKNDLKAFDNMFNRHHHKMQKMRNIDLDMPLFMMDTVKIKTEFDDDKFKIIIGLKPFQGDENKINYNIDKRKLTVFGASKVKDKDYEQDIEFSQDFILPDNADITNISKEKDNNKLVISIPLKG